MNSTRRKFLLSIPAFLILCSSQKIFAKGSKKSSKEAMKYCRIKYKSFYFGCETLFNGASVVSVKEGNNLSTSFEVNEWVKNGENTITLDLTGNKSKDIPGSALVNIEISLSDTKDGEGKNVATLDVGPKDVSKGKITKKFTLPAMAFAEYDDQILKPINVNDKKEMENFMNTYNVYYKAMADKKIDAAMKYHQYRADVYDKRYYLPAGDRFKKLKEGLQESFKTEFLLKRLPNLEKINVHMDNKLLTVDYSDDNTPITSYTNQGAEYTRYYQAYWGKNDKGEYFIYR